MSSFVYIHSCPNGKKYVGITRQRPEKRWNNGCGYVKNEHFTRAIKKYGWENIDHMVIEVDTETEMYYLERYLIAYYNSNNPKYGYNNSRGGDSGGYGVVQSKETIEKRKGTLIERYGTLVNDGCFKKGMKTWTKGLKGVSSGWVKGNSFTDLHRKKLSISHIGHKDSEETKKKKSISGIVTSVSPDTVIPIATIDAASTRLYTIGKISAIAPSRCFFSFSLSIISCLDNLCS